MAFSAVPFSRRDISGGILRPPWEAESSSFLVYWNCDGETGAWSYLAAEDRLISVSKLGFEACTYIIIQSPCSDRQR